MHTSALNLAIQAKNHVDAAILAAKHYRAHNGELVMHDRLGGFFSIYCQVLGALYVSNVLKCGLTLEFTKAAYYTPTLSPTGWWDHYFTTSAYNRLYNTRKTSVQLPAVRKTARFIRLGLSLERSLAHKLTLQLDLKSGIKGEIDEFSQTHFRNRKVIGIHYRGTDKVDGLQKEADRVPYQAVISALSQLDTNVHFFVATDEQAFVDALKDSFGERLIQRQQYRSSNGVPLHHLDPDKRDLGYARGLDALIDAFLLSRTNAIIRTDSNLSLVSGFFNPRIPLVKLDRILGRPGQDWLHKLAMPPAGNSN